MRAEFTGQRYAKLKSKVLGHLEGSFRNIFDPLSSPVADVLCDVPVVCSLSEILASLRSRVRGSTLLMVHREKRISRYLRETLRILIQGGATAKGKYPEFWKKLGGSYDVGAQPYEYDADLASVEQRVQSVSDTSGAPTDNPGYIEGRLVLDLDVRMPVYGMRGKICRATGSISLVLRKTEIALRINEGGDTSGGMIEGIFEILPDCVDPGVEIVYQDRLVHRELSFEEHGRSAYQDCEFGEAHIS